VGEKGSCGECERAHFLPYGLLLPLISRGEERLACKKRQMRGPKTTRAGVTSAQRRSGSNSLPAAESTVLLLQRKKMSLLPLTCIFALNLSCPAISSAVSSSTRSGPRSWLRTRSTRGARTGDPREMRRRRRHILPSTPRLAFLYLCRGAFFLALASLHCLLALTLAEKGGEAEAERETRREMDKASG